MATSTLALAQRHMVEQVKDASIVQAALSVAYDRLLDPSDLDGTFPTFVRYAVPLIQVARGRGSLRADRFYSAARTASDLSAAIPAVPAQGLNLVAATAALRVNGPVKVKQKIAAGENPARAVALAKVTTLNAAKRLSLEASRNRLISLTKADADARAWARVSDGAPCAFCAMLVSRGPVYSESTAYFETHNGCGCSAEPVFRTSPSRGWNPMSRELADLWNQSGGMADFRSSYTKQLADSTSSTATALANVAKLAA
jgi:hypothetical protein